MGRGVPCSGLLKREVLAGGHHSCDVWIFPPRKDTANGSWRLGGGWGLASLAEKLNLNELPTSPVIDEQEQKRGLLGAPVYLLTHALSLSHTLGPVPQ